MVFKLCVSTPLLRIIGTIRTYRKNSPAGSPLRIVQQEGFRLPFAPPLRTVRASLGRCASQFEKRSTTQIHIVTLSKNLEVLKVAKYKNITIATKQTFL